MNQIDGLELLKQIEEYRSGINEKNDYPPSDYHVRVCEAFIAKMLGFSSRAEWTSELEQKKGLVYKDGWTLKDA
jgi:hypothetical protein